MTILDSIKERLPMWIMALTAIILLGIMIWQALKKSLGGLS
jgi:hypothetical protein